MARYREPIDRTAVTALAIVSLVVLAIIAYAISIFSEPSPYAGIDTNTFCRTSGARSVTVVLVDATDPFLPQQRERLTVELTKLKNAIPRFDRLALFAIDARSPHSAQHLADACNPGTADTIDTFNEAPKIIKKKYNELFDLPFQEALTAIVDASPADRSPIIEAIEHVTVRTFQGAPDDASVSKKLIVVSDMLQNTQDISFYKNVPTFPDFQGADAFKMHRPSLTGVEVVVWEVNRPRAVTPDARETAPAPSRSKIAEFWSQYLKIQGARLTGTYWDATKI